MTSQTLKQFAQLLITSQEG